MSGFRCLTLETGVAAPTVAACNGDRECELALPSGRKVAAALFDAIDRALENVGLSLPELDCIAFGKGPGAFTGLRVAASAAQGLGAGLGLRLCPVSSLAALAQDALDQDSLAQDSLGHLQRPSGADGLRVVPLLSAGRGEVYAGWYQAADSGLVVPRSEDRIARAEDLRFPGAAPFLAAGAAWEECAVTQSAQRSRIMARAPAAKPRARTILRLAQAEYRLGRLVSPQDAQPVYFRDAV